MTSSCPSNPFFTNRFFTLLTATFFAGAWNLVPMNVPAAEADATTAASAVQGQLYASPEAAIQALQTAAAAKDTGSLEQIFGPEFKEILTGDKVLDANHQH